MKPDTPERFDQAQTLGTNDPVETVFLRNTMLWGVDAGRQLLKSHVAVVGLGGVGSWAAEALARAGVGHLTLMDPDRVNQTNINRQLCATHSTVGMYKADVMRARVLDVFPSIQVTAINLAYDQETKVAFWSEPYDYVIDAIDQVTHKLDLIVTAQEKGISLISALGIGNKIDPSRLQIGDISNARDCHLARVIRKELRQRGVLHHTVLWSSEKAVAPLSLEAPPPGRRSVPASVPWLPACAGLMMAGHVVETLISPYWQGDR